MTVEWNRTTKRIISRKVGEWEKNERFLNGIGGNVKVGDKGKTHVEVIPTRLNRLFLFGGIQRVHVYDTDKGIKEFSRIGKPIKRQRYIQGNGVIIKAW